MARKHQLLSERGVQPMVANRLATVLTLLSYCLSTVAIALLVHNVFIGALTNSRPKWEIAYTLAGLVGVVFYIYQWKNERISTLVRNVFAVVVPVGSALVALLIEARSL